MTCETIDLGEFTVGEIPAPLVYQYLDASGSPINIAGWVAKFNAGDTFGTQVTYDATVTDGANGRVTYVWDGVEFTAPGSYEGQFWVGNGTNRFASQIITWIVRQTVGAVPSI